MKQMLNKLIAGDARKLIKEIPDNRIDLILTDPPYGLNQSEHDNAENFYELEDELYRVLKPDGALVFFWSVKKLDEPFKRLKRFKFVWQIICEFLSTVSKSRIGDRKYAPVLVFEKTRCEVRSKKVDIIFSTELPLVVGKIGNPQFKPTVAISELIRMFSRENEIILDPFAGFGSILLCAKLWNRKFIGFEIDPKHYAIASEILKTMRVPFIGNEKELDKKQLNIFVRN